MPSNPHSGRVFGTWSRTARQWCPNEARARLCACTYGNVYLPEWPLQKAKVPSVFAAAHRVKLTAALDSLPLAGARQEGPDARLIRHCLELPDEYIARGIGPEARACAAKLPLRNAAVAHAVHARVLPRLERAF